MGVCSKCGECCKWVSFIVNSVMSKDKRRYYELHNVKIIRLKRDQYQLLVPCVCSVLGKDNLCKIFKDRPYLCRDTSKRDNAYKHECCTDV